MIGRALGLILVVCATGWAQENSLKAPAASDRVVIVVGGMDLFGTGPLDSDSLSANSNLGSRSDPLSSYAAMSAKSSPPKSGLESFSNNSLELAAKMGGSQKGYHFVPWSGNLLGPNDHANATEAVKAFIVKQLEAGKTVSVLAHSDGAMIAYNALTDISNGPPIKTPAGAHVDKFVTIGTRRSDITRRSGGRPNMNAPTILKGGWLNVASATDDLSDAINRPGIVDAAISAPYEDKLFSFKKEFPFISINTEEHFQYYDDQLVREALQVVLESDGKVGVIQLPKALTTYSLLEQQTAKRMQERRMLLMVLSDKARWESQRDGVIEWRESAWNNNLKLGEYQLAKSVTDAHGNRVRIEAYILRPQPNQVQQLVLNAREQRFDYGYILSTFFGPVSGLAEAKTATQNTFFSPTMPTNYLTQYDLVATNTVDRIRQTTNLGAPAGLNFGASTLFFPATIDMTLRLTGPGYDKIKETVATTHNGTQFTYRVQFPNAVGTLADFLNMTYTPSTGVCVSCTPNLAVAPTQTVGSTTGPEGGVSSKVTFKDGTFLTTDTWWVKNDGVVSAPPRLASPLEDPKSVLKDLNLEMRITASEFTKDIDIVLPGEAFTTGATSGQDVRKN